jgi:hypothetical protein
MAAGRTGRNPVPEDPDAGLPVSSSDHSRRYNACWPLSRIGLDIRGMMFHARETYPFRVVSDDPPPERRTVLDLCTPDVLAPHPNSP